MALNPANQLHEAARLLAADDPDHAQVDNGIGFSKADSWFGHYLVTVDPSEWTDEIIHDAYYCLRYYRAQLAAKGIDFDSIERPASRSAGAGREQVTEGRKATKAAATAAAKAQSIIDERTITVSNGVVSIRWNKKDPEFRTFYNAVKAAGARWNGTVWTLPTANVTKVLIDALGTFDFPADFVQLLITAPERPVLGTVVVDGDQLKVTVNGYLGNDFNAFRALDGYRWARNPKEISYVAPTATNVAWLLQHDFSVADEVGPFIARQALQTAQNERVAEELAEASRAAETTTSFDHLLPEGRTLYPFQTAGIEYALRTRRCLIGDEMGLGKTPQAIVTIEADQAYPALIVCPASLKGNWEREINVWVPNRTVTVLSGRTPNASALKADFVIANYDIISGWQDALVAHGFNAIVLDESHYVKEERSARTKAAVKVAATIPSTGLRLCLTGTPILNRPKELVTQLQVLDRLSDVTGPIRRGNHAGAFKFRYCGPEQNRYGWTFNGASNLGELNDKLRKTCFVRRLRTDVLDLTETHRIQIPLSLNGGLDNYRRAEDDIIAYLREEIGSAAALRAKRAEVLVQLNTLRRLAEEAKVPATIEWIEDFIESNPEKSLVVFAEHVSVQKALVEHFNCPSILGGQKDVEAQKAAFQAREHKIIVCSIKAAREGHTLVAASDVVFTSLGWTPGGLQQAEDRCNRIGQTADKVIAWQLHAADTIDEKIAELIENKRSVFNALVNGEGDSVDDEVFFGVVDYLQGKSGGQSQQLKDAKALQNRAHQVGRLARKASGSKR